MSTKIDFKLFCIFFGLVSTAAGSSNSLRTDEMEINGVLNSAIAQICHHEFSKFESLTVVYGINRNRKIWSELDRMIQKIMKCTLVSTKQITRNFDPSKHKLTTPILTIIDNITSFELIEEELQYENVKIGNFHLILLVEQHRKPEGIERIFKIYWKKLTLNVNVIHIENDSIEMLTYFPFLQDCNN